MVLRWIIVTRSRTLSTTTRSVNLDQRGSTAMIPPKADGKIQRDYETEVYKWRHLVENAAS